MIDSNDSWLRFRPRSARAVIQTTAIDALRFVKETVEASTTDDDGENPTPNSVKMVQIPAVTSRTRDPGIHVVIKTAKTYRNVTATPSGATKSRIKTAAITKGRSVRNVPLDHCPKDMPRVGRIVFGLCEE
jgi:hypothetical protein